MRNRISYEAGATIGYVYVMSDITPGMSKKTDELEVNTFISYDLDKKQRIIGLELFHSEVGFLAQAKQAAPAYSIHKDRYRFRLNNSTIASTYRLHGIEFHFAEQNYRKLIGFDIVDLDLYKDEELFFE